MQLRNFYSFISTKKSLEELENLKISLLDMGKSLEIKGTILLAEEGINAAISAESTQNLDKMQSYLESELASKFIPIITNLLEKEPDNNKLPFRKFKVKIKKEIVALGIDDIDPACNTGAFVDPKDWNSLISDPKTITIDTRNAYEYYVGHFKGAHNPDTNVFREFVTYVRQLDPKTYTNIAMYCTGGIRCEKASSFMRSLHITNIYQLKGGILNYFQQIAPTESLWEGSCFVFDDRIAVDKEMHPTRISVKDIPQQLHNQKQRSPHTGHIYKKIMSLVQ